MRFLIFIYGKSRMKRTQLVSDKRAECHILLPKDDFSLERTVFLQFKNISGEWFIKETDCCHLKTEEFFQMGKRKSDEGIFYKLSIGRKNELSVGGKDLYIQLIRYRNDWSIYKKYKLRDCRIIKEKNIFIMMEKAINRKNSMGISYEYGKWFIEKCGNIEIYINEILLEKKQQLEFGDVICIGTIYLLFFENYIAVEAGERNIVSDYLEEVVLENEIKGQEDVRKKEKREITFHRAPRVMEELKKVSLKVDAPPQVDVQEKKSIFMDIGTIMNLMFPMLGMNLFLIYGMKSEQNQAGIYVYSGLFMAVMSAVCSILWLMISRKYEKREQQKKVNKERLAYRRYLNKKSEYIKVQYERVYKVLQSRYLRADTYLDSPLLDMYLWNRNLYHKDFLMYRIGIGDVEFPMKIEFPEEVFGDEENILWREAKKIKEHYEILHQIPVLLDMGRYSQIGIITKDTIAGMELVRSIILQIALCNCYTEVKIGCIYNKNKVIQSQQWDFCRWLPHIWDANRQKRFIAGNEVEARRLFYDLLQIFKEREEVSISGKAEKILPHYILFVAEEQFLEGEMFSKYILDRGREYGLTVVWLDSMRKKLPNTCKMVLEINGGFTGRYEIERHSQKKEKINFDYTEKNIAEKLIRSISGIKVMEIEEKAGIPEVVDFLGMYDVHTIEELHIKQRWEKNRIFGKAEKILPHYILFVAEEQFLEGEMFSKYILDRGREYGLTVVWLDSMRKKLPNTCKMVLEINGGFTGRYEIERHSQKKEKINFDYTEKNIAEKLIRSISGIKVMEIEEKAGIPEVVDFLGMYDVHTIEELHIKQRWEKNRIFESAKVLIGKKAGDEPFYLDIHERYHGPHGLLAGTTGSGKSEVLQTFILSMAVNFSPEAVCFLLIDYKGEGMSALFSELPHISGKISNLSDGQAYRAMVSIKSENKRRQRIFKECKVNNINDYTRLFNSGSVNEPIPHLLIIIDEFAELKKAKPEFMQELISVAQVGRSLGVHLLLATQKPGGVVDDKIWSNSRFRICLKVQEREDSMDMLHNMDACQITQTGRGYLQVGNNEVYELFQAGWSGALFQQEDTEVAACLVQTDGTIYKRRKNAEKNREKKITQLQAIKQYIIRFAKEKEYQEGRKLWLEPLSKYIYLDEIHKEMNKKLKEKRQRVDMNKNLEVCVGIFDDPENQEQSIFSLNLMESGHIAICGRSASGKSTFFQTFLFSLLKESTAEEVCLYLLDFNGSGMDIYDLMPQVKQVIKEEEEDKVEELFENIKKEMKRRKKKFSGGNFKQYKNKSNEDKRDVGKEDNVSLNQIENEKEEFPLILIIVDGFVEFCEETYQRYDDSLYLILREGEKLGIKVMISIESFSGMYISMRIAELFKTKICLYMKDKYAYTEVFDVIQISVFPKAEIPGRGIAYYGERILEFQTALALNVHNDYERREKIKEVLNRGVADGIC